MRYVRAYHRPGEMNKTETAYAQYLDLLKRAGQVDSWSYEIETLKIGKDCRYTPDFRVITTGFPEDPTKPCYSIIEFHEVKGTVRKSRTTETKPYIEDDALVKIKAAAEMHPYKFIIVWKGKDGKWERREIN
jgi:hypothetical protein